VAYVALANEIDVVMGPHYFHFNVHLCFETELKQGISTQTREF